MDHLSFKQENQLLPTILGGKRMKAAVANQIGISSALMFVKNAGDTCFSVIHMEEGRLVKKIGEGQYPHVAFFHPNGRFAYLSYIVSSSIEVVDLRALEIKNKVTDLGKGTVGICISREGRYLFTGSYGKFPDGGGPGISIFDTNFGRTADLTLVKRIPVGMCAGMVVDSKNDLWAAIADEGKVLRINGAPPFDIKDVFEVGEKPHDLIFSKELQLLQVNPANESYVTYIDTLQNEIIGKVPCGANPHGGKFSIRDGIIRNIVPSRKENVVSVIDIGHVRKRRVGNELLEEALIGQIDVGTPQGFVDITRDGRYAILDAYQTKYLSIIDLKAMELARTIPVGMMPMHPQITWDGLTCFVASMKEGTVSAVDITSLYDQNPAGVFIRTTIHDVGVEPSGNFFSYRGYLV